MPEQRIGREGGKWINERPTPEAFGDWFAKNMQIDPLLDVEKYVGGVVLIPAVDNRARVITGWTDEGAPIIAEQPELSYVPYAKVDTRINYFWDMLDAHDELIGLVIPERSDRLPIAADATVSTVEEDGKVTTTRQPSRPGALTALVHQLPDGFAMMSVPVGEGYSHFVLSTLRVSIYAVADLERALDKTDGDMLKAAQITIPRRTGRGTKQVPLLRRGYQSSVRPDESVLMKAETGALGRALGFAGIFVIPGSGVATAEDMQDLADQGAPVAQSEAKLPDDAPAKTPAEASADEQQQLKARAIELWKALAARGDDTAAVKDFRDWASKRGVQGVGDAKGATLRGMVKKLEALTDQGRADADSSGDAGTGGSGAGPGGEGAVRDNPGAEDVGDAG